ncbi:MAG TPA: glucosamine-6-phosphate deaminase [Chthoniobacteraceae bacterium]|jgi:glucosamine-6-phosphate deaminase|nr:glucosamine-6-phosphate deaminase [Chthoniobacteraceae bacterium]
MPRTNYEQLEVHVHPTRGALGAEAAAHVAKSVAAAIDSNDGARVIFACAPSQNEFLEALVAQPIDWAKVTAFHMDEYVGITAEHPASFRRYLDEHLLQRIDPVQAVHWIRAEEEPAAECRRYAALLSERPIDLVCLGIGENGHIAFNDPPVADFLDTNLIKVVELDATCRQQQVNDGCFPNFESVPTHALTLTVPALFGTREISCVVPGERKAAAVRATLLGPIETACPASILRTHPRTVLHLDEASAALLPE